MDINQGIRRVSPEQGYKLQISSATLNKLNDWAEGEYFRVSLK